MGNIARNVIAVVVGIVAGGCVNMALVMISGMVIPPPEGVDVMDVESIRESLHLFQPKHFLMPFLAHALGTLTGALVACLLAVSHRMKFAIGLGAFNLLGGIAAVAMIPAPAWFSALDLIVAYLPMSWLGGQLGCRVVEGGSSYSEAHQIWFFHTNVTSELFPRPRTRFLKCPQS
jgi:hypothetical protein